MAQAPKVAKIQTEPAFNNKTEYFVVRKSDGARMCNLLLGENGCGISPYEVTTCRNPDLTLTLNRILEQEAAGRVSLGKA